MIVAPGWTLQHVAAQHDEDLVARQDLARIVHQADPVGIAVEGDADIGLLRRDGGDQLVEILRNGRIGMMGGKATVDGSVQYDVMARQAL